MLQFEPTQNRSNKPTNGNAWLGGSKFERATSKCARRLDVWRL